MGATPPEDGLYLALFIGFEMGNDGCGNILFGGGLEVGKKAVSLANAAESTIPPS